MRLNPFAADETPRPLASEQRLDVRRTCRLRVALGKMAVWSWDLSPRGFCAELLHVLAPGELSTGSILLGVKEFPFTGEVVWSNAGDPLRARRGRIGVRFTGIEPRFFHVFQNVFPAP